MINHFFSPNNKDVCSRGLKVLGALALKLNIARLCLTREARLGLESVAKLGLPSIAKLCLPSEVSLICFSFGNDGLKM